MKRSHRFGLRSFSAILVAVFFCTYSAVRACSYAFDEIVPDVRQPVSVSGGSACPVRAHQRTSPGSIALRWSTTLGINPVSILTQDQTAAGRLNEIEHVISESLAAWTGVSGTTPAPSSFATLAHVAAANSCSSDGVNSICFDQPDGAFTPGVLGLHARDYRGPIGVQVGNAAPSTEVGQILDADIYFNPGNSTVSYATPAALAANPRGPRFLESLLTHELGHFRALQPRSAIWNAMMYPYATAPGTFSGTDRRATTRRAAWRGRPRWPSRVVPVAHRCDKHRLNPRPHPPRKLTFAAERATRSYRSLRIARGRNRCRQRRRHRRPRSAAGFAPILARAI